MAFTDIDICNKALLKLGESTISSFDDGTEVASTCGTIYPDYVKSLISAYNWSFARQKVQLAKLTTAPVLDYDYAYQLPSDMLRLIAVFDDNQSPANNVLDYRVHQDELHTQEDGVWIEYIKDVGEEEWPSHFVEFVATALAAELAMPITNQLNLQQLYYQQAFGSPSENRRGGKFNESAGIDSMQEPPRRIDYASVAQSRWSGF